MLKRKIQNRIQEWITNRENALLVDGARQVGKTYIIRKCLKESASSHAEFNLIQMEGLASGLASISNTNDLIALLSLFTKNKLKKGSLIFIDEIQECPEFMTKIKFLVDEGAYRYIMSGSLLGVRLHGISSAPVGYLDTLTMYPMDFEEFLQIYNFSDTTKAVLQEAFQKRIPVNEAIHDKMMSIFRTYLLVGGMPQAVDSFRENGNLETVARIHENIILQYRKDIAKYEQDDKKLLLGRIYDLIPAELSSQSRRFNYQSLKKGIRSGSVTDSFLWLENAGVALATYNAREPVYPLLLNRESTLFKLFLSDVGMLTTMYGRDTKLRILNGNEDLNLGAVYENAVAQELRAHGFDTYYFRSKKMGELDFIIEKDGSILQIEVKSGKDYRKHSALNSAMSVRNYKFPKAYVLNNYNVSEKDNIVYLPVYMLMFIQRDDSTLPTVEINSF